MNYHEPPTWTGNQPCISPEEPLKLRSVKSISLPLSLPPALPFSLFPSTLLPFSFTPYFSPFLPALPSLSSFILSSLLSFLSYFPPSLPLSPFSPCLPFLPSFHLSFFFLYLSLPFCFFFPFLLSNFSLCMFHFVYAKRAQALMLVDTMSVYLLNSISCLQGDLSAPEKDMASLAKLSPKLQATVSQLPNPTVGHFFTNYCLSSNQIQPDSVGTSLLL